MLSSEHEPRQRTDLSMACIAAIWRKNIAEPTQFKPSPHLAVMVAAREREKDLAKKISESTQIKPNNVRAVLTALHTIA